ncbi:hypothetical protein [Pseudogemmobacter sonorensis]|uniref:hypothetical protein n=1 Tax=Pseudogemmobacter sonorensis TaxID=2989681 RepID=UPI0036C83ECB
MERRLPLALFGLSFGVLPIILARRQANRYQACLARHSDTTNEMLEDQRLTQAMIARRTEALERIAAARERRR